MTQCNRDDPPQGLLGVDHKRINELVNAAHASLNGIMALLGMIVSRGFVVDHKVFGSFTIRMGPEPKDSDA